MNEINKRAITDETLDNLISRYTRKGFKIVSRTQTTAQLVRDNKFSCLIASVTFLFFAIPFFIYLFWYLSKREKTIYIQIVNYDDPENRAIKITTNKGRGNYLTKDPTVSSLPGIEELPKWLKIILVVVIVIFFTLVIVSLAMTQ